MSEEFHHIGDIFQQLDWSARTQPLSEDVMEITTREGLEKARELINRCLHDGTITAAELSRRTDIKQSAISAVKTGKWKGKQGTLLTTASLLVKAINQVLRQRRADETRIDGYVETRVAREIHNIVWRAVDRRLIAAFILPAGSGKTMAMEAMHDDRPGSVLLTVTRSRSSVKSLLQLWARTLGLHEVGRAEDIQDAIMNRLAGSDRLVLIDEAHKLSVAALDAIREVWDEVHVPIVLAGTPSLGRTMTSRRVGNLGSELMDQLASRVAFYRDFRELTNPETGESERLFTVEDVRNVFHRGNVRLSRDGADFLCRLSNLLGCGGLRTCRHLVEICADAVKGTDSAITASALESALVAKFGLHRATYIIKMSNDEATEEPIPAVASA